VDPIVLRLAQMLLATLLGGVVVVLGIVLLLRGIAGRSNLILEGGGVKAKLVNGSPGLVIALIGAAIIAWSLSSGATEHVITKTEEPLSNQNQLDKWLLNARHLNGRETYTQVLSILFGDDSFRDDHITIDRNMTLSEVAGQVYHDPKYWLIISALNMDRGYYTFATATPETLLRNGTFVEFVAPASFTPVVKTYEQFLQVKAIDVQAASDELLALATSGTPFSQAVLDQFEHKMRVKYNLGMAYQFPTDRDSYTLTELSLKYYQSKKYWPIIPWVNGLKTTNPNTTISLDGRTEIPFFLPPG
jgi:hypothetical protein